MKNKELANLLYQISKIIEIKGIPWKPLAYKKAAKTIENLKQPIEDVAKGGQKELEKLPNIGKGISKKIIEYLKTGKIKEFEILKKKEPKSLIKLMNIPSLGPKKVKLFYNELNIKTIKDLKKSIINKSLIKLPSIKQKTIENIKKGINLIKSNPKRRPIGEIYPIAKSIVKKLKDKNTNIEKIEIVGSLRRMKDTIGDIDILITVKSKKKSNINQIMDDFTSLDVVKRTILKGITKTSVIIKKYNLQVDLRVINDSSFGSAMQYFIGNREHNIELRKIAIKKGYKLSEYGLFKDQKLIAGKSERNIYKKLGLEYIEPELRKNDGEIELAMKNKLPKLINYNDIKGDLHMHTNWSDGQNSIEEMIQASIKMKYEYMAITDHSKKLNLFNKFSKKFNQKSEDKLKEQIKYIKKLRKKYKNIKILCGSEVNILEDGSLDLSNKLLSKLDIVIGSIHSSFNMSEQKTTQRIVNALSNKHLMILGHPTCRTINRRNPLKMNFDEILTTAKEKNKILEVDSQINRLDLKDELIKKTISKKVKLVINTDSHSNLSLGNIKFGIGQARRAWAQKKDIINTQPFKNIKKRFNIHY